MSLAENNPCNSVIILPASLEELLEHTKHSWQYPLVEVPTKIKHSVRQKSYYTKGNNHVKQI